MDYLDVLTENDGFIDIVPFHTLSGGYLEEEAWLLRLKSNKQYVIKIIHYSYSINHLENILQFQNNVYFNIDYLCSQTILTLKSKLFIQIENGNHFIFV